MSADWLRDALYFMLAYHGTASKEANIIMLAQVSKEDKLHYHNSYKECDIEGVMA